MGRNPMIEPDFDGLRDSDFVVILMMGDAPVTDGRLHRLALIESELYDPGASDFWYGYSDNTDEAAHRLTSMGILRRTPDGRILSGYGTDLRDYIIAEWTEIRRIDTIQNMKEALKDVPDRNLMGLTYRFYPERAVNPTVEQPVNAFNESAVINGIPLAEYPKERFEAELREGKEIVMG